METIQSIFVQLGVDNTIIIQFISLIAVVFITNMFFFNSLKKVLDLRDENTTQLESSIEEKGQEVEKLDQEYKFQLDEAYLQAQKMLDQKKIEAINRENEFYSLKEKEVNSFIDEERKKIEVEVAQKRKELFSNTDGLVKLLVKKFTE